MGQRTWVGYADSDSIQNNLLKPGVLKTTTGSHDVWHNPQTIDQNYTTHYSPSKDIYIIFKSYSQLGNRAAQ